MRLARLTLALFFMAAWFGAVTRFHFFFHSNRPALGLMFCLFLFVTDRWHHWFRRLRPNDELTQLNLNSDTYHG